MNQSPTSTDNAARETGQKKVISQYVGCSKIYWLSLNPLEVTPSGTATGRKPQQNTEQDFWLNLAQRICYGSREEENDTLFSDEPVVTFPDRTNPDVGRYATCTPEPIDLPGLLTFEEAKILAREMYGEGMNVFRNEPEDE